ncbi:unnamed protein product [Pylaiella littoralis]
MKSSDPPRRAWQKTSQPTFVMNKQNGKGRLRLQYSRGRGHKPKPVTSTQFPSRKDAELAAFRWRTSWEEGRKGDLADEPQHDSHTEETSASSLVLPQGKSLHSLGKLCAIQERAYKKQRREGAPRGRYQWMKVKILTLGRLRRFAQRSRDYCRAYVAHENGGAIESKDKIEQMRKIAKAHRNIIDMEPGFIDKQ